MTRMRYSVLLAPLLALAGCSAVEEEHVVAEQVLSDEPPQQALLDAVKAEGKQESPDNCLLMIWSEQDDPAVEFDRANDAVQGGAISCATGTTPSRFEAAIAALREAASSGNRAGLLERVGIPLLYITESGERRELTADEIDALFDEVFDARMLDTLKRLDLSQMTVEPDQGAFFELGTVWLVVDETGEPRMMTVNRQALTEAAETARDQAARGEGEPL